MRFQSRAATEAVLLGLVRPPVSNSGPDLSFRPPRVRQALSSLRTFARNRTPLTIERAVATFLAEHAETSAQKHTQKKYRILMNKLRVYSEAKGYVVIDRWGPIDVREFRSTWPVSPATAAKNMSNLKAFFEFAVSNEWIARNPARLLKNPRGRASSDPRQEERSPFSDEELKRMFEASETQYGKRSIRWSRKTHQRPAEMGLTANYKYRWTGQDLADFISISVYTGLRISDVSTFRIDRLQENGECHIRTTKNGRRVYTWIPEWAAGTYSGPRRKIWSSYIRPTLHARHERDHRCVAAEAQAIVGTLWSLA